jgi:hypothetical protein
MSTEWFSAFHLLAFDLLGMGDTLPLAHDGGYLDSPYLTSLDFQRLGNLVRERLSVAAEGRWCDALERRDFGTLLGLLEAVQAASQTGDGQPPAPARRKRRRRWEWIAEAMLLVKEHPDWPDRQIAARVRVHPSQLVEDRCPEYAMAAALARGERGDRPPGHVQFDEGGLRSVDGYSSEDDPARKDWDGD